MTRRQLLFGTAAAMLLPPPRAAASKLALAFPPGACDCHTHVFGDAARFAFWSNRTYTPPEAAVADWQAIHRTPRTDRGILIQPSVYGTDNRCMVEAIGRLGRRARGVAVIDENASDRELDALHRSGVRGIRLNLETFGIADPAAATARLQRALTQLAAVAGPVVRAVVDRADPGVGRAAVSAADRLRSFRRRAGRRRRQRSRVSVARAARSCRDRVRQGVSGVSGLLVGTAGLRRRRSARARSRRGQSRARAVGQRPLRIPAVARDTTSRRSVRT